MREHVRSVVCGCVVILIVASTSAVLALDSKQQDKTKHGYALRLLDLSGMQQQLAQIPDAIQSGFEGINEEFSASQKHRLEQQVELAFEEARLEKVVLETLETELSEEALLGAINWYRDGLGQRISDLETERSNLTSQDQRDRFFRRLAQKPPADERVSALTELDLAWKATDASVSLMLDMQVAVSAAVMSRMPASERLPLSQLIKSAENQRDLLVRHYTSETQLSMLYVYEELTIAEINDYKRFAMTEHGMHFVDAINLALHKAMLEGSYGLGQGLGALMREMPEQVM